MRLSRACLEAYASENDGEKRAIAREALALAKDRDKFAAALVELDGKQVYCAKRSKKLLQTIADAKVLTAIRKNTP